MPAKKTTDRARTSTRKEEMPSKGPRAAKGRTSASSARTATPPKRSQDPEVTPAIGTPARKPKRAAAALSKTGKKPARGRAEQPEKKRAGSASKGTRGRSSQKSTGKSR